jgi:fused signal recognition particle receptor
MSPPVLAGLIVAAIVVIVIIVIVMRRRKDEQGEPLPESDVESELQPHEEEPVQELDEGVGSEAAPDEVVTETAQEPETIAAEPVEKRMTAPGVRLDESEEAAAAQKLVDTKRERKLKKLRKGLAPTRGGFIAKIGAIFKEKKTIDPALLDELEETLITADVGSKTVEWFITLLKEALEKNELADPDAVWSLLRAEVERVLTIEAEPWDFSKSKPFTIMVVGVNGVGKTTTIGKLASQYSGQGHKVVLAAADTFRAAAVNQLEIWGRRTNCEVIKSKEGADPSSVVFDAIKYAKENGADVVIADTAGRLHTKAPLMEEIKKVSRVMVKAADGAPYQILLVLDATTGQNALQQVKEFGDAIDLTGIALTKLDGTAKGGVIIGICHEHKIPVRFIGIGEAKDDLREFDVKDFVEALFYKEKDNEGE